MNGRQKIIEAAYELFTTEGFVETTVDDIAATAGVSKGLAYHHFSSKEDLFLEIIKMRLEELDHVVEKLRDEPMARKRLEILCEELVAEVTQSEDKQRFLITTFIDKGNAKVVKKAMAEMRHKFQALHDEELRILTDLGFRDPKRELLLLRSTLQGMALLYLLDSNSFPLEQVKKDLVKRYLNT